MKKTFLPALLCFLFTAGFSQDKQKQASLQSAHWEHTKKKAELIAENALVIEMEFGRKATVIKFGNEKLEMSKKGFWCPRIVVKKDGEPIASQKYVGLWGSKKVIEIDGRMYTAKTKQGRFTNITYSNENEEILTYRLDVSKRKPLITFEIKASDIPEQHLFLLLASGFYSIRNIPEDSGAAIFIIMAVA
jgi:hypothetical protein